MSENWFDLYNFDPQSGDPDSMSAYFPQGQGEDLEWNDSSFLEVISTQPIEHQADSNPTPTANSGTVDVSALQQQPTPSHQPSNGYASAAYHQQALQSTGFIGHRNQPRLQELTQTGSFPSGDGLISSFTPDVNGNTSTSAVRPSQRKRSARDRDVASSIGDPPRRRSRASSISTSDASGLDRLPSQPVSIPSNALSRRSVLALTLTPEDEMQCRFAVKNDEKESNRKMPFVQANGYVEYKARYCKKRGHQVGYGHFHLKFTPTSRVLFPVQRAPEPGISHSNSSVLNSIVFQDQVDVHGLQRVDIFVRFYQSWRGDYPATVFKFSQDEIYHPMFVKDWQEATLLTRQRIPGLTAHVDPDGEHLRFTVHSSAALHSLMSEEGIKFPCPIPSHPERLNDVGMMRMQVSVQFHSTRPCGLPTNTHFQTWIRVKIVQQLSGKKLRFSRMLREPTDEFTLPPLPVKQSSPAASSARLLGHVLGKQCLQGRDAIHLLQELAVEVAARIAETVKSGPHPRHAQPAIHQAAAVGDVGIVLMLLQNETSLVHARDEDGNTPLHFAAENGHLAVVSLLFEAGAMVHEVNNKQETPIDLAQRNNFHHIADMLLKDQNGAQGTILRAASSGNSSSVYRHLLATADPDQINAQGHTPVLLAITHNHPLTLIMLLRGGADATITTRRGHNALHHAAAQGTLECLCVLLQHCPDIINEGTTVHCHTALHLAVKNNHPVCLQALLSAGANPLKMDKNSKTAFNLAIEHRRPECLALLLKSADSSEIEVLMGHINSMFSQPRVGGDLLNAANHSDVMLAHQLMRVPDQLLLHDRNRHTALHLSARSGALFVLDEICSHLADSSEAVRNEVSGMRNYDGQTPLHLACHKDASCSLVLLLATKMFNVNEQDHGGNTALHLAAQKGLAFHVMFLLLGGADSSIVNHQGLGPLEVAKQHKYEGCVKLLQVSAPEMVAASRVLEKQPATGTAFPSLSNTGYTHCIDWTLLHNVLARLWHSTHDARTTVSQRTRLS